MDSVDWNSVLAKHEVFGKLEPGARREFLSKHSGGERSFAEGDVILQEGEIGDSIFIIGEGAVDVKLRRRDEEDLRLYTLREGEIFGEMAMLEQRPRAATLIATKESTVLEIPGDDFRGLMKEHHEIALYVLAKLSQRLRYTDDKILDNRIRGLDQTVDGLKSEIDKVANKSYAELTTAKDLANKADSSIEQLRNWITWILALTVGVLTLGGGILAGVTFFGIQKFDDLFVGAKNEVSRKVETFTSDVDREAEKIKSLTGSVKLSIKETRRAEALLLVNLLDQYATNKTLTDEAMLTYNKSLRYAVDQKDTEILKKIKGIMEEQALLEGRSIHQFLYSTIYNMSADPMKQKKPGEIILTYYLAAVSAIAQNEEEKAERYVSELESYVLQNKQEIKVPLDIILEEEQSIRNFLEPEEKDQAIKAKQIKQIDRLFDAIAYVT